MAIIFDHDTSLIRLTSPQTTLLLMQDLINEIRIEEASERGIQYLKIAEGEGKVDIGGGVASDITVTLLDSWQIQHTQGGYQAIIKGGQVVGGLNDNPISYVAGVQVKMIQSVAGIISVVTTGSGLSSEQDERLAAVWKLMGLDTTNPVTTTKTSADVGTIHQNISGDGVNTSTITRTS